MISTVISCTRLAASSPLARRRPARRLRSRCGSCRVPAPAVDRSPVPPARQARRATPARRAHAATRRRARQARHGVPKRPVGGRHVAEPAPVAHAGVKAGQSLRRRRSSDHRRASRHRPRLHRLRHDARGYFCHARRHARVTAAQAGAPVARAGAEGAAIVEIGLAPRRCSESSFIAVARPVSDRDVTRCRAARRDAVPPF
jgi:hypothetical protein